MVLGAYIIKTTRSDGQTLVFAHDSSIEKTLGNCLEFLNRGYRENSERFFDDSSSFSWIIKNFDTGEIFSGSCDLLLSYSFLDLIPEMDLSQYEFFRA